ncbi:right-handed parallel beta-helix repeat-containing protein [Acuticoccus sediminis]|uniref:right-handed parallel beta-helix repeat-containing protein n=1 Tax=Acuticoccus sediminis TaxID=2184697 RepID=UPI001CFE0C92|nr:right-handed parallel beta-helix repeat-containing protein [Acuticoccus sediminis]
MTPSVVTLSIYLDNDQTVTFRLSDTEGNDYPLGSGTIELTVFSGASTIFSETLTPTVYDAYVALPWVVDKGLTRIFYSYYRDLAYRFDFNDGGTTRTFLTGPIKVMTHPFGGVGSTSVAVVVNDADLVVSAVIGDTQGDAAQTLADRVAAAASADEASGYADDASASATAAAASATAASDHADDADTARLAVEAALEVVNGPFVARDLANLEALSFPPEAKTIEVQRYADTSPRGRASYARVWEQPVGHEGWRRSADRYLPDGTTDATNGGYFILDEDEPDPTMFGASCNHREVVDAAITSGSSTITSATANFTFADVGRRIVVALAGPLSAGGAQRQPLRGTITAVTNSMTATVSTAAGATVSAAKCSIYTDDTAAIRRAATFAIKTGRTHSYGPRTYSWAGSGTAGITLEAGESLTIKGAHRDRSTLFFDAPATTGTFIEGRSTTATEDRAERVSITGMNFRGVHDYCAYESAVNPESDNPHILRFRSINELEFRANSVRFCRGFGFIARNCQRVTVKDNYWHVIANDCISVQQCDTGEISGNLIEYCDDDAIALHGQELYDADYATRGWICTNNIIVGSQGIKGDGLRTAIIANNKLLFCRSIGISVGTVTDTGADFNPTHGVLIVNNIIENHLVRGEMTDDYNAQGLAIRVQATAADNGSAAAIPWDNDSLTGAVVDLYDYADLAPAAGDPVPPVFDVTVRGNKVIRTAKAGTLYSDLGYGAYARLWDTTYDPVLTEAMLRIDGVQIRGDRLRYVDVSDNSFTGIANGVTFAFGADNDAPLVFSDVYIRRNRFVDLTEYGIGTNIYNGTDKFVVYVEDNLFDLDPGVKHPGRTSTGAWANDNDLVAININLATTRSFILNRNTFRNLSEATTGGMTSIAGAGNVFECDPTGTPSTNRGVRVLPSATDVWGYRIIDGNPNSETFGKLLNPCPLAAAAIPTSGTWVQGQMVRLTTPEVSADSVFWGGLRATTGPGNEIDTDWIPLYFARAA